MSHEPRWLVMDVGNSAIKLGLFPAPPLPLPVLPRSGSPATAFPFFAQPGEPLVFRLDRQQPDWEQLAGWLPKRLERACLVSVCRPLAETFQAWWQTRYPGVMLQWLSGADFPIENRVDFPERVGVDRLAAATAARFRLSPGEGAVVVDAGSAITVDVVDEQGAFRGGAILPGRRLMAAALFQGTDQLPHLETAAVSEEPPVVGTSTEKAIRSGIDWGVVGAVRELIARMSFRLQQPPRLFLTGGDAVWLEQQLQLRATHDPHLVLHGIHAAAIHRAARDERGSSNES